MGIFGDMIQGMMEGIIRAMGYQHIATAWELVAYWGVMVPFGYIFAFWFDFGFIGVWVGLPLWSIMLWAAFVYLIVTVNWTKWAEEASKNKDSWYLEIN